VLIRHYTHAHSMFYIRFTRCYWFFRTSKHPKRNLATESTRRDDTLAERIHGARVSAMGCIELDDGVVWCAGARRWCEAARLLWEEWDGMGGYVH
jgi:hypothetical protein